MSNNWIYKNQEITIENIEKISQNAIGFVYLITNKINNKKYIGRKLIRKNIIRTIDKKKKKIIILDTKFIDYYSSSSELKKDVEILKKDNFSREILYFCHSRVELNYLEEKEQYQRSVLEDESYYNNNIRSKYYKKIILSKVKNKILS
jgi:hypothetical protein